MSSSTVTVTEAPEFQAPLLRLRQGGTSDSGSTRSPALSLILGRVIGRRGPSMMVRETAARELEERRADWGYSKPVVALDITWNMAFVVVSVVMLICTAKEKPCTPIRLWICGYSLQCLVHVVLVWLEFRIRNGRGLRRRRSVVDLESQNGSGQDGNDSQELEENGGSASNVRPGLTKRFESINTMLSFIWWVMGFYWVVSGDDTLLHQAPHLYWLAVVFLAFDIFFAVFCVVLACIIGVALCCCMPCIIAILYAVAGQEGASEADLSVLPKYRFQILKDVEKPNGGEGTMVPVDSNTSATERVLLPEDAECCICLASYEDGVELHTLPCNHHFHSSCIERWLKMNATCPLCKYNILKGNESD